MPRSKHEEKPKAPKFDKSHTASEIHFLIIRETAIMKLGKNEWESFKRTRCGAMFGGVGNVVAAKGAKRDGCVPVLPQVD